MYTKSREHLQLDGSIEDTLNKSHPLGVCYIGREIGHCLDSLQLRIDTPQLADCVKKAVSVTAQLHCISGTPMDF